MSTIRSALLLCGSPKGAKGSSWELGSYLMRRLGTKGVKIARRTIAPTETLIEDVRGADLVILSFPLYADGIPARFKTALMEIAQAQTGRKFCAALVQCGFLESSQNDTAIEMCRLFARDAGFEWLGGLGRGGGGMLEGKPLENGPRLLIPTRHALDLAADCLAQGKPFTGEIHKGFRAQLMPRWIYAMAANLGFWLQIIRNGRVFSIYRKPYQ